MLRSRNPDWPFCLCWANEDWTRSRDGRRGEVLMGQAYSPEDDRRHLQALLPAFDDPRYLRVDGKPLFLVYRAGRLPDPRGTTESWREEARRAGAGELHLCRVESFPDERGDPRALGFDAAVEFQPDWRLLTRGLRARSIPRWPGALAAPRHRVFDYALVVDRMLAKPVPAYPWARCVIPGWDNSPRRPRGAVVLAGSTPEGYGRWLSAVLAQARGPDPLVFLNAWNEWGEGCHLEPDLRHGRAYLEATRDALAAAVSLPPAGPGAGAPSVTRLEPEARRSRSGDTGPPTGPDAPA